MYEVISITATGETKNTLISIKEFAEKELLLEAGRIMGFAQQQFGKPISLKINLPDKSFNFKNKHGHFAGKAMLTNIN